MNDAREVVKTIEGLRKLPEFVYTGVEVALGATLRLGPKAGAWTTMSGPSALTWLEKVTWKQPAIAGDTRADLVLEVSSDFTFAMSDMLPLLPGAAPSPGLAPPPLPAPSLPEPKVTLTLAQAAIETTYIFVGDPGRLTTVVVSHQ